MYVVVVHFPGNRGMKVIDRPYYTVHGQSLCTSIYIYM